jgi:hypothetical protein
VRASDSDDCALFMKAMFIRQAQILDFLGKQYKVTSVCVRNTEPPSGPSMRYSVNSTT